MKGLIVLFVAFLSCLSIPLSAAGSGDQKTDTPVPPQQLSKITLLHLKPASKRPNAPSRVGIECVYGEGYMTFAIPDSSFSLFVNVYNESAEWTGVVTQDDSTFELPDSMAGLYSVECTADDGRTYAGTIEY